MKKTIKFLSVLLILILSLSCISITSASAKSYTGNSGSIKWTVNTSSKKLVLQPKKSGSKCEIPKYTSNPPWYKHRTSIVHIVIKNGINTINQGAFTSLTSVKDISIGKDVKTINSLAFTGCSALTKFTVNVSNANFTTVSGILFTKNKNTLYSYPRNKSGSSYSIPSTVTYLKHCAFYGNKNLTSVGQDSSSVTSIGDKVFKNCSKLKKVYIKNNCTSLGKEVFLDSLNLTSVTIPPSVITISDSGKTLFSPSSKVKNLTVYLAPNSLIKTKLTGKSYTLKDKDYMFTCKFDAGENLENEIDPQKTVIYGKAYGDLPEPEKTGYDFNGWYLDIKKITSGTLVSVAKTHTLKARFKGKEYTINLDTNGGTCDYKNITVVFGEKFGVLPSATRKGYIFLGWFTEDGVKITSQSIFEDENIDTLYAHWRKEIGQVKNLKISYKSKNKVRLTWNKVSDVSGYKIYKKVNNGKFKLHKTVKKTKYITPNLSPKKKYTYKIRAYRKDNKIMSYGLYSSSVKRVKTFIQKPTLTTQYRKNLHIFCVKWKNTGASKYEVYQKKGKKWKRVSTTTNRKFYFYPHKNKTYTFKIKGYKKVLKHRYYSKFSKTIKLKIK